MPGVSDVISREQIETALRWLDQALEQSDILTDVIPIHMVSYGGMLAVCLFGIRDSTRDIDVLLPSNVRDSAVRRNEFTRLVSGVAAELNLPQDWINDDLRLFVPVEKRQRLLEDSIEQGVAVFEGRNLVIWAGVWDFGLESKLHRLSSDSGRSAASRARMEKDTSDAVELVHRIKGGGASAQPLDKAWVMGLRRFGSNPSEFEEPISRVAQAYITKYGTQGIVELVCEEGKYKYQNLAGQWIWYESRG